MRKAPVEYRTYPLGDPARKSVATIVLPWADWLKLDDAGRSFTGDRLLNDSYYAEGQDAIAVADGMVVVTKDGIPFPE